MPQHHVQRTIDVDAPGVIEAAQQALVTQRDDAVFIVTDPQGQRWEVNLSGGGRLRRADPTSVHVMTGSDGLPLGVYATVDAAKDRCRPDIEWRWVAALRQWEGDVPARVTIVECQVET